MPDCWATGCKSRNNNSRKNKTQLQWEHSHGQKITFHRMPKNPKEREKWLERLGLNNKDVPEKAKLCSLHFEESAFDRRDDYYIRIRPGVIPLGNASVSNIEVPQKKQKVLDTTDEANIDPKTIEEILNAKQGTMQDHSYCRSDIRGTAMIESTILNASSTNQAIDAVFQPSTPCKVKHQGTSVSPHLSEDTPRKRILRTALDNTKEDFKKKIKCLQQKYRRSTKCIANLKNILASLQKKHLLDPQQLDILNNIGICNK